MKRTALSTACVMGRRSLRTAYIPPHSTSSPPRTQRLRCSPLLPACPPQSGGRSGHLLPLLRLLHSTAASSPLPPQLPNAAGTPTPTPTRSFATAPQKDQHEQRLLREWLEALTADLDLTEKRGEAGSRREAVNAIPLLPLSLRSSQVEELERLHAQLIELRRWNQEADERMEQMYNQLFARDSPPPSPPSPPPASPVSPPTAVSGASALPLDEKRPPLRVRLRQRLTDGRPRWRNYLLLGLAGAASYAAFSLSVDFIVFLSSIRHAETLEFTYVAGAAVLASTLGFFALARRAIPSPLAPLYRLALRRVRKDPQIRQELGHRLRFGSTFPSSPPSLATPTTSPSTSSPSSSSSASSILASGFRLVTRLPAGPRWSAEPGVTYWGWERYWQPRRTQFVVTVEGERGRGVMLAQVDHKVDERRVVRHLSVERVVPSFVQPSRIVIEQDGGEWSTEASRSSQRI